MGGLQLQNLDWADVMAELVKNAQVNVQPGTSGSSTVIAPPHAMGEDVVQNNSVYVPPNTNIQNVQITWPSNGAVYQVMLI